MRVLFVCLGNICRSPLAEGVFRHHVEAAGLSDRFTIDSAGTGGWHVGSPPDERSVAVARTHGIDITAQRGRRFEAADLNRFDYVFAMDRQNLADIQRIGGEGSAAVALFLDEAPEVGAHEVPDPYYGGPDGFEQVYRMIDAASRNLLARLRDT